MPHRVVRIFPRRGIAEDQAGFPKAEGAMLFERSHAAQHSLVIEMRETPFHGLLHFGTSSVNQFAEVIQDGLGEVGGLRDISVDARVFCSHASVREGQYPAKSIHFPIAFGSAGVSPAVFGVPPKNISGRATAPFRSFASRSAGRRPERPGRVALPKSIAPFCLRVLTGEKYARHGRAFACYGSEP